MTQEQNEILKELMEGVIEANQILSDAKNGAVNAQALVNKLQTELDHFRMSLLEPHKPPPAPTKRPYVRKAKTTHATGMELLKTANNAAVAE